MRIIILFIFINTALSREDATIIKIKSKNIAIIEISEDDFLDIGDIFLFNNKQGKCLVDILKVRGSKAAISLKKCRHLNVRKGGRLTYIPLEIESNQFSNNGQRQPASFRGNRGPKSLIKGKIPGFLELKAFAGIELYSPSQFENENVVIPLDDGASLNGKRDVRRKTLYSFGGSAELYSSDRREVGVAFGASEFYETTTSNFNGQIGSNNFTYNDKEIDNYSLFGFVISLAPIIPSIRIRPLFGYSKGSFNLTSKSTGSSEYLGKTKKHDDEESIKGDAKNISYGVHYDIKPTRKNSFIKLYLSKSEIDFDDKKIDSVDVELINVNIRFETDSNNESWFELGYTRDKEESKDWSLSGGYKFKNFIFELGYSQEPDTNLKGEDYVQKSIGFDIGFYFSSIGLLGI